MQDGTLVTCCACGTMFEMNKVHNDSLRKTGKLFYCPAGHAQSYTPEPTEEDKLRKQLENANFALMRAKDRTEFAENQYRCCIAGCAFWRNTKAALRKHLEREHGFHAADVKKLPANAGKNAHNSDVGA